jgi:ketosteroid isomerase-like protein
MWTDHFKAVRYSDHTTEADQNAAPIVGPTGNEAWWFGAWSATYQVHNGPPQQGKGYWSSVYIREGDTWKICLETYNVAPPPAATTAATHSPTATASNQ